MLALKTIKSYVKRQGRITPGQLRSMASLYPKYHLERFGELEIVFQNQHETWLDIGIGNGESLLGFASRYPDINFIGVDVYEPGIGQTSQAVARDQLQNVRLRVGDVEEMLSAERPIEIFTRINMYFPDPWPKKRHQKRRLLKPEFLERCVSALKAKGVFHFVTDDDDYALQVKSCLEQHSGIISVDESLAKMYRLERPETKFERRAKKLSHNIHEFIYEKLQ